MQLWDVEDGLPVSTIYALAQSPDGMIWVGTEDGLARFDGTAFELVDLSAAAGSPTEFIASLAVGTDGTVYAGTGASGVVAIDRADVAAGVAGDWTGRPVEVLLVDATRRLAGVRGGALVDFAGTPRWLDTAEGLAGRGVTGLAPRAAGGSWVGLAEGGVQRHQGGRLAQVPALAPLAMMHVEDLLEDRLGGLWVGTREGLYHLLGDSLVRYGTEHGLPSTFVNSLLEDREGTLWVGTGGDGLARFCNGRFEVLGVDGGLPLGQVEDLMQARDGSLWLAAGALVRLSEGAAIPITAREGLPDVPILPILQARDGSIWMGTFGGGLVQWSDGVQRVLTRADGMASDFVLSLAEDPDGSLWVGTRSGLDRVRGGKVDAARVGPDGTVFSLLHDGSRLWIGLVDGVAVLEQGRLRPLQAPAGGLGAQVVFLFSDARGQVWAGTDGAGLFRVEQDVLQPAPFAAQLPSQVVLAAHETGQGVLWIGTSRGLARWDGHRLATVSTRHGLVEDPVSSILADGDGHLWLSGNRGLSRLSLAELDAVAAGQRETLVAHALTQADGMPRAETNGGFQPAAWRDRSGRHWYPTSSGVALVDTTQAAQPAPPPQVRLRSVLANGGPVPIGDGIELGPNPDSLEFRYQAAAFSRPGSVTFQYRLLGVDDHWFAAGSHHTAVYRQLPPGPFSFQVRAREGNGPWSSAASLPVHVRPHLLETPWFWGLLLVLGGAGALVLARRRLALRAARLARQQQQRHLESMAVLSTGVARDFQNVLGSIAERGEGIAAALPSGHPLHEAACEILRAAGRGTALNGQLLAFARAQSGAPRAVDMAGKLADMEPDIRAMLPATISLAVSSDPRAGRCLVDPGQLEQLVWNLVENARDAMPDGGSLHIALAVAERHELEAAGLPADRPFARVTVSDSGPGMDAATRAHVFEPFFSTHPEARNGGMGLSVALGIALGAGGSIDVVTAPGLGAAFHVLLPAEPAQERDSGLVSAAVPAAADRLAAAPAPTAAAVAATSRVLVVDDEADCAATVAAIAQGDGAEARTAGNPAEFFELVRSWSPTHVVVDLAMPAMDGIQVVQALSQMGFLGHATITSGMGLRVLEAAARSCREQGLQVGVLPKPFRVADVRAVLRPTPDRAAATKTTAARAQHDVDEREFARALDRNELVAHYQPKIDLRSGRVAGFEALVRWQHRDRGLVYPDAFIPLAEATGLVRRMSEFVIRTSLGWLAEIAPRGDLLLSINLSAQCVEDQAIAELLQRTCDRLGLAPGRVVLELTETSAMLDPVRALEMLTRLRLRGFGLAIDDFGTGFSSMLQLARLPFSQIKIDRSFVGSMGESLESRKIVETILGLGQALKLTTVAEGVEDAQAMSTLRHLGCDLAQGYHIARPMDGNAARQWLANHGSAVRPTEGEAAP